MKHLFLIFLSLPFLINCTDRNKLNKVCPQYCWAIPGISDGVTERERDGIKYKLHGKDRVGLGQCKRGESVCDENANIIECVGEVLPEREVCNNIDDNCDGNVDRNDYGNILIKYGEAANCLTLGECAETVMICEDGEWKCDYASTVEFPDETSCDLRDNDCDGRVDEDLFGEFCYEVPPELLYTALNNPCRPGRYDCFRGEKTCMGQVRPTIEVCNRIDDNCDGLIDNINGEEIIQYDIVFAIDHSGSMCGYIGAVAAALDAYISQFEVDPNMRFALVVVTELYDYYSRVSVRVPFGNLASIHDELLYIGCRGSGYESNRDGLYLIGHIDDPLELNWRENAIRLQFLFSDETDQSYTTPEIMPDDVIDACLESGTIAYIWGSYPSSFPTIATETGGEYFRLSTAWENILYDLNSIIINQLCEIE